MIFLLISNNINKINNIILLKIPKIYIKKNIINKLKILQKILQKNNFFKFKKWIRCCCSNKIKYIIDQSNYFYNKKKIKKDFFKYGLYVIKYSLLNHLNHIKSFNLENKFIIKFSNFLSFSKINKIYNIFNKYYFLLKKNINLKIFYLSLSLKISNIFKK